MKNALFPFLLSFAVFSARSQTTRYFEFRQPLNDTSISSFIVATSDASVINEVLYDLDLPVDQRRFISGNITNGDGGFNHDGMNPSTWHFIFNEWQLTGFNVEHCDGISSSIGNNPDVIAGDTILFCPWNSYPFQEVDEPLLSLDDLNADMQVAIYPNPVDETVRITWTGTNPLFVEIYTVSGQLIHTTQLARQENGIDVHELENGIYFIRITDGEKKGIKKLMVKH